MSSSMQSAVPDTPMQGPQQFVAFAKTAKTAKLGSFAAAAREPGVAPTTRAKAVGLAPATRVGMNDGRGIVVALYEGLDLCRLLPARVRVAIDARAAMAIA